MMRRQCIGDRAQGNDRDGNRDIAEERRLTADRAAGHPIVGDDLVLR